MDSNDNIIIQEVIKEMKEIDAKAAAEGRESGYYENLPTILKENRDIIITAFNCPNTFVGKHALPAFSHDKEVAKLAICDYWENARNFSDVLDKEFILDLAKSGAWLGVAASDGVLQVVRENSPEIFQDDDYMKELLKYPEATVFFAYASDKIKSDKEIVMNIATTHDIFVPYYIYLNIGDNLKKDPEVQKACAQSMMKNYGDEGEEAYYFMERIGENYNNLTKIDKEFAKNIVNEEGFIEQAITFASYGKEDLEFIKNKINQSSIGATSENNQELEIIFEEDSKDSQDGYKPYK